MKQFSSGSNQDGALYQHDSLRRLKLIKRFFAIALFGGTFVTAFLFRRRRAKQLDFFLEGCERLPSDENFTSSKSTQFYRYKSCILPEYVISSGVHKQVKTFVTRPDDVFIVGYPKSGITWLLELVYLMRNNLNFKDAASANLESRVPFLEYLYPGIRSIQQIKEPRIIKTHLPYWLLPEDISESGAKIIFIIRNPKDVVVSYYHFAKMFSMTSYSGTFDHFVDKFIRDELPYSPYFKHLLSYWEHRDEPNVLLVHYEDLKRDPAHQINRISRFIDRPVTADQVDLLVDHTQFKKMKTNPAVNYSHWDDLGLRNRNEAAFLRKGDVGDWKNYFSADRSSQFDQWIAYNLEDTGLKFRD